MSREQKTLPCATGSIKFRIIASSFAGMVLSFLLIDIVVIAFDFNFAFREAFADQKAFWTPKYIAIAGVELFLLIMKVVAGNRNVAHKLEPVEALSRMAMELNNQSGAFDEEKIKALEEAIERMDEDGGSINTGNKELAGLELAVNQLVRRMRESYMQQARFVSDASHELRTPIAIIKGYADMLDRWGKKDEKILDESVEAIKSESERMNYLVEQLLFLARGDCGKTQLKLEEFDLQEMMTEVFEEYKMIDAGHEYFLRGGDPVMITGDKTLLKQSARVLVDNSAKYTPEGLKITLGAGWITEHDGKKAYFMVQDNGIGIGGSDLPFMFERFYRVDDSRTKNTGGTGLGLAIAKWIVDRHGGRFDVLSKEDIGTRIKVVLPVNVK